MSRPAPFVPASLDSVRVSGEWQYRLQLNAARLNGPEYLPPAVFSSFPAGAYGWPADMEGRTLLALTLHGRIAGASAAKAQALLDGYVHRAGSDGVAGEVQSGVADEQQLAGHSWLLRALCEYWLWTGSERVRATAERVVDRLYAPLERAYACYPVAGADRRSVGGQPIGAHTGQVVDGWRLSGDTGCAFIALDGITHALELFGGTRTLTVAHAMARRFLQIDPVALRFQTHASLTACRGLLRLWRLTGEADYLKAVQSLTRRYLRTAVTATCENHNWFGRPEWTEPCAVVDSYMLCTQLWAATGDTDWMEYAHRILYNGLGAGLRPTGAFGCNCCTGADRPELTPHAGCYEVTWCCTMRGAEGLTSAMRDVLHAANEGRYRVLHYADGLFSAGHGSDTLQLRMRTGYPLQGTAHMTVLRAPATPVELGLYIPFWLEHAALKLPDGSVLQSQDKGFLMVHRTLSAGDVLELHADLKERTESGGASGSLTTRWIGPLMMTQRADVPDAPLRPIWTICREPDAVVRQARWRVCW